MIDLMMDEAHLVNMDWTVKVIAIRIWVKCGLNVICERLIPRQTRPHSDKVLFSDLLPLVHIILGVCEFRHILLLVMLIGRIVANETPLQVISQRSKSASMEKTWWLLSQFRYCYLLMRFGVEFFPFHFIEVTS